MAKSKDLSKKQQAEVTSQNRETPSGEPAPNPAWFKPVMFGFMLVGLVWIVLYYITAATLALPIPQLGQNNIFVGFGLILIGFLMTTRWR
ncbi:cell division protein CrgA [Leucobacter chinensis]|uniref:cell division protein CrgA n=1 Tax=Leucobacter chinensis TaxID=2851010 RepID=UPI001C21953D|nr:cell division protein CrgA [Leucobacter chinensis]